MISFVETKLFTRLVQEYLSDDEYSELQQALIANPEAGAVVPGSGGIRKLRWGRGRSWQARRYPGHLLSPHAAGADLDADPVSEKCCRDHSGACSKTNQG